MAPEVQFARLELLDAATDLLHLALNNHDTMVMNVLNQFEFWSAVPAGGFATYGEIVQATKLPEEVTGKLVSYWDYLKGQPEGKPAGFREKRFAEAMQAAAAVAGVGVHEYLRDNYDWASLGEAKVINYVVKILENIAPHLKSGSHLVMFVFPSLDAECKYPLPRAAMRILAATDLQMLSFANAVERTLEEWRAP
ncbi:Hypothetical protein PENO1_072720 [Penicillium occitanis (nom. inval.)]|nr:hypothetical protein PENOC_085400 [Penicillium occitanis (nom. inval.)]PCG95607.1 Hypothetical protein PENO1_072720 [Penicillium occitanis (nom. inval.)]